MFFNRSKQQDAAARTGLTDGIEDKVAAFVRDWGAVKRGERDIRSVVDQAPLQLVTDADVALFLQLMEDEAAKIEAELQAVIRSRNAEIAQKDAERVYLLREKERVIAETQRTIDGQAAEIQRRALVRADLLGTVARIDPSLDATKIVKDADIRREVVRRKFGAVAVDGKSEAYIDERFESMAARANVDPFARVVADGLVSSAADNGKAAADRAYDEYVKSLTESYRTKH